MFYVNSKPKIKQLIRDYWCLHVCDVTKSRRHIDIMMIIAIQCDSLCTNSIVDFWRCPADNNNA